MRIIASKAVSAKIPGPAHTSFLGWLPWFLGFAYNPLASLEKLRKQYGDMIWLGAGKYPVIAIFDPELNRQILRDPSVFYSYEPELIPVPLSKDSSIVRVMTGMPLMNGPRHNDHRTALLPYFHKKFITRYYESSVRVTERKLASWKPGLQVDMRREMEQLAMWLAMWQKGEHGGVWEGAKGALDEFAKASIVDYSAYLIYSHLAEITILALEESKENPLFRVQMEEIEKYTKIAIKNLKKYSAVFAIGGPALYRYRGQLEWHYGNPERAYPLWRAAGEKAQSFPIAYEAGRAELLLGLRLPAGDPTREAHLHRAQVIFEKAGCENWAGVARQQLLSNAVVSPHAD